MNIDVLAYELKFKNDQMVLDLLKAYQELMATNGELIEGDYE